MKKTKLLKKKMNKLNEVNFNILDKQQLDIVMSFSL